MDDAAAYVKNLAKMLSGGVPPIIRPYVDRADSIVRKLEGAARTLYYKSLKPAAFIVKWTDRTGGFGFASLDTEDWSIFFGEEEGRAGAPERRFPEFLRGMVPPESGRKRVCMAVRLAIIVAALAFAGGLEAQSRASLLENRALLVDQAMAGELSHHLVIAREVVWASRTCVSDLQFLVFEGVFEGGDVLVGWDPNFYVELSFFYEWVARSHRSQDLTSPANLLQGLLVAEGFTLNVDFDEFLLSLALSLSGASRQALLRGEGEHPFTDILADGGQCQ